MPPVETTLGSRICTREMYVYLLGDALLHEWGSDVYLEANNLRFELNSNHQGR